MTRPKKRDKSDLPLTPKQRAFVSAIVEGKSQTEAARLAGYAMIDQAHKLAAKPHVALAIQRARNALARKIEVTPQRIAEEFARIAFSDVRELFNEDGSLKPITELSDSAAAAIASVEVEEETELKTVGRQAKRIKTRVSKIKAWDKIAALVNLAKQLGMFPAKNHRHEHEHKGQVEQHVILRGVFDSLPLDTRKQLLDAVRKRREQQADQSKVVLPIGFKELPEPIQNLPESPPAPSPETPSGGP